jgi:hypothetical protein
VDAAQKNFDTSFSFQYFATILHGFSVSVSNIIKLKYFSMSEFFREHSLSFTENIKKSVKNQFKITNLTQVIPEFAINTLSGIFIGSLIASKLII